MNTQISDSGALPIQSGNLLIVDDRKENLFALKELLAPYCEEVTCVESGNEALSLLLKDNQFSLILLDVQMPGLDGFETLSLMRKHPKTRDIPVIFITAIHKDEKYLHLGYETGAVDYICKPIDPVLMRSKVSVFLDMATNKEKLEVDLQQSIDLEKAKQTILDHSSEGIVNVDEFGFITFANPACTRLLGYDGESIEKKHIFKLLSPDLSFIGNWQQSNYANAITESRHIKENNVHLYKKDGSAISVDLSFGSYQQGKDKGGVFVFQDTSERKREDEALLVLATHDSLTQLPNKLILKENLASSISRADRYEHELYIMLIDLDRFKHVNDQLGQYAGDSLLRDVAKRLLAVGRAVDFFARIGSDQFAVIFEDDSYNFDADMVANKLLRAMETPFNIDDQQMHISASIGVVKYPQYGKTADELLSAADYAMQQAKQNGRNQFAHFNSLSQPQMLDKADFEYNLRLALTNNEITCVFQPIVDAQHNTVMIEVLVRWEHPVLGKLLPEQFLPIAQEIDLINDLGYRVFQLAIEQYQSWCQQGLCSKDVKLCFNLSTEQFFRKMIVDDILRIREQFGIDLSQIVLEVKETTLLEDVEMTSSVLHELKTMGVSIALDCYGAGYSSLKLLSGLPLTYIKIDRMFNNVEKSVNQKIIKSISFFADMLSLQVIAVGVETLYQQQFLQELKIDYQQGFWIQEPVASSEIEQFLTMKMHSTG